MIQCHILELVYIHIFKNYDKYPKIYTYRYDLKTSRNKKQDIKMTQASASNKKISASKRPALKTFEDVLKNIKESNGNYTCSWCGNNYHGHPFCNEMNEVIKNDENGWCLRFFAAAFQKWIFESAKAGVAQRLTIDSAFEDLSIQTTYMWSMVKYHGNAITKIAGNGKHVSMKALVPMPTGRVGYQLTSGRKVLWIDIAKDDAVLTEGSSEPLESMDDLNTVSFYDVAWPPVAEREHVVRFFDTVEAFEMWAQSQCSVVEPPQKVVLAKVSTKGWGHKAEVQKPSTEVVVTKKPPAETQVIQPKGDESRPFLQVIQEPAPVIQRPEPAAPSPKEYAEKILNLMSILPPQMIRSAVLDYMLYTKAPSDKFVEHIRYIISSSTVENVRAVLELFTDC